MATAYLRTKSSSVSKINDEEPLSQQHAKPKPAAGSLFTTMVLYLHAISGGFVLIHGLWLCALVLWHTATRGRLPQPETNWIVPALALTTALRDATGVRLAAKYRKGEHEHAGCPDLHDDYQHYSSAASFAAKPR